MSRDEMPAILVTGGAGYIGSHTCLELLIKGYNVFVYDNFSNSHPASLQQVEKLANRKLKVFFGDVRDEEKLFTTLKDSKCTGVIHFAGLKSVGDSVNDPLKYYDNNITGTLSLIRAMRRANLRSIIFSSSATVYGEPQFLPLIETHKLQATNPYGRTKLFIEEIFRDLFNSEPEWKIFLLRYFNPVGAHESGSIGEDPRGIPNNLMPFIAQVATDSREMLKIWGNDYETHDGTGVRDYIHVVDLALGHVRALECLKSPQCVSINLGTGVGNSVLEVIKAFETVSGKKIAFEFASRRQGDVASCFADVSLAERLLSWRATRNLNDMCRDAWRWQSQNPNGFNDD